MPVRRIDSRARAWRALALSLLAVLSMIIGSDIVRASASDGPGACDGGAAVPTASQAARVLPPEWRWTAAVVPLDRLYGTPVPR